MGFLKILRDSAKVCGDSQGFSGFPQKPNEVSGVERVKVGVKVDPYRGRYDFQPRNEGLLGATKWPSGTPHEGAPNNHDLACFYRTFLAGPTLSNLWSL